MRPLNRHRFEVDGVTGKTIPFDNVSLLPVYREMLAAMHFPLTSADSIPEKVVKPIAIRRCSAFA